MSEQQAIDGVQPKPLALYKAMHAARAGMPIVPKTGHNKFDDYHYSQISDFIQAIQEHLNQFGLLVMFDPLKHEWLEDRTTSQGKLEHCVRVLLKGTVIHVETGEEKSTEMWGEGQDRGDKAYYKANTGARKYALANLFNLASGDDPETHSPETVARQQGDNPFRGRQQQRSRQPQRSQERRADGREQSRPAQARPAQANRAAPVLNDETDVGAWERHDLTAYLSAVNTTTQLRTVLDRLAACPVWLAHVGDWQWACKSIADRYRQMRQSEGCNEDPELVDRLKEEHKKLEDLNNDPFGEKEKPDAQPTTGGDTSEAAVPDQREDLPADTPQ